LSAQKPLGFHSKIQGEILEQCPECEAAGFTASPCDECGGDPDQIGGTEPSKCEGDEYIELKCPVCNGEGLA